MLKKYCNQALKLTQYILEQYWQRNLEPLLSYISDDILWIGSMDEEYLHGKEAMVKRIKENNQEMPIVYLDDQEYEVVQNGSNDCVIVGRYKAYTKPESKMILTEKQRITFVWSKEKDKLLIKHIHLSNVLHIQEDDERFPTKAGKENYDYLMRIMAERSRNEVITVKDENHASRIINFSDIMYITSIGNYILISLSSEKDALKVRGNLSTFTEKLSDNFIQPSRSFTVNKSYIKKLEGKMLVMIDGEKFYIPSAGLKSFKNKMK